MQIDEAEFERLKRVETTARVCLSRLRASGPTMWTTRESHLEYILLKAFELDLELRCHVMPGTVPSDSLELSPE